jgi:hypothetical protein
MRLPLPLCFGALLLPGPLLAQTPDISPDSLRVSLYTLAADSMGGRQTGEVGDWKAQEWIAAQFRSLGLQQAGDSGTFIQVIHFTRVFIDTTSRISVGRGGGGGGGSATLAVGRDFLFSTPRVSFPLKRVRAIFGGWADRPDTWIDRRPPADGVVVLAVSDSLRELRQVRHTHAGAPSSVLSRRHGCRGGSARSCGARSRPAASGGKDDDR